MKDVNEYYKCCRVTDARSVSPYSTQYGYTANDTMFKGKGGAPIS